MLKINLITVGNLKEDYWKKAVAEYEKRLSRFCKFEIFEVKESDKAAEAKALLQKSAGGFLVALDPFGRQVTSEEFSHFITSKTAKGVSKITFFIGGSDGLDSTVLATCDDKLSFSKMTFPHQMFRVIFTEQLYRAFMIAGGGVYHK